MNEREVAMRRLLSVVWNDDEGQDLVEYALLLTLIVLVVVGFIQPIANTLTTFFNRAADLF